MGKSKRVIDKKDLENFEKRFVLEITNGVHDFISTVSSNDKTPFKYKIEKMPELPLPW